MDKDNKVLNGDVFSNNKEEVTFEKDINYKGIDKGLDKDLIIIKIGTSSLVMPDQELNIATLGRLIAEVKNLRNKGYKVVITSSGAVGIGCQIMNLKQRPTDFNQLAALSGIGQSRLMRLYEDLFHLVGLKVSQILLSKSDFNSKSRFESAARTLKCMLDYGVIPIVNENDTVNTPDVKFGDNDTVSAMVAILCNAKWCFLLTDVDFLYDKNPKNNPEANPIYEVFDINEITSVDTSTMGTQWGVGGMITKIKSAQLATAAGVNLVITNSQCPENLSEILEGKKKGTVFYGKKVDSSITKNRKYYFSNT